MKLNRAQTFHGGSSEIDPLPVSPIVLAVTLNMYFLFKCTVDSYITVSHVWEGLRCVCFLFSFCRSNLYRCRQHVKGDEYEIGIWQNAESEVMKRD